MSWIALPIAFLVASHAQAPVCPPGDWTRSVPNEAFGFGERLEYDVKYRFITAGKAYFQIAPEPVYRYNRPCYDIRFEVRSVPALDWLYRVRDFYRTVIDVAGIFPYEFEQRLREGGYRRDFTARLDHARCRAITSDGEFAIPRYVHDIVSAFYYVRTLKLSAMPKDTVLRLQNFYGTKTYDLGVRIHGKQVVSVSSGTFRCILIEPLVTEGGLFKSEGRILMWLTDDDRKIPVKVVTKVLIGTIEAELTGYSGLRGPLLAKLK
ncbi:MAG: DUF3108 domain-containing protein [Candidatus Kapabacteria bacterium]|nr:DUF3108 domain-containing protein [Candidatus Kapabacteria bacterium]MDW8012803.1 DUF3108 domain-containing protein [Bacteroidota bacterium]